MVVVADTQPAHADPALDLHEGISHPGAQLACARWPAEYRLRSTLGALVMGRCKATNLCAYCARLAAIENSELLALDAMRGSAPMVWLVLTTPSTDPDPAAFYKARELLVRALKRRFPELEYAALVEFTTGYGTNAGGKRRPHWNLLLKGVTPADMGEISRVVSKVWCPRVNASRRAQHVGSIPEAGGLMRYLALHFQKQSQAPPVGWRGHRFIKSRGYLWTDTPAAREEAQQALRLKRELRKAEALGLPADVALEVAELALYEANELAWELVREVKLPTAFGADGFPVEWSSEYVEVRR